MSAIAGRLADVFAELSHDRPLVEADGFERHLDVVEPVEESRPLVRVTVLGHLAPGLLDGSEELLAEVRKDDVAPRETAEDRQSDDHAEDSAERGERVMHVR